MKTITNEEMNGLKIFIEEAIFCMRTKERNGYSDKEFKTLHPMEIFKMPKIKKELKPLEWMPKMLPSRPGANDHVSIPSREGVESKEFTGSFISMASHLIRSTTTGSRTATKGGWKAGN